MTIRQADCDEFVSSLCKWFIIRIRILINEKSRGGKCTNVECAADYVIMEQEIRATQVTSFFAKTVRGPLHLPIVLYRGKRYSAQFCNAVLALTMSL
jgi:hypothetical protein